MLQKSCQEIYFYFKNFHFADNDGKHSKRSLNYNRLCKVRNVFDKLNFSFKQLYELTEGVAADEVIIKFTGQILLQQYIPNKCKQWE